MVPCASNRFFLFACWRPSRFDLGLLKQSPVLAFLTRDKRLALFTVFLGLGVVVTMNCLTDSIFQSAVSLRAYMVITLFFLKARDA